MSITNPTEGRQLLAKAIRDSQRVDTIGDTVSFTMKVLSTPVPRSSEDMGAVFGGDSTLDTFDDPIEDRLQFKGRIEGEYFMSPHMCIPDPCNIYGATNSTIAAYQSLHTTCITPKGFNSSLKIGDRVRVTCRKGDFKMDLQFANVDSVETSMMSVQTETEIQECQILSTRFADGSDFLDNLGADTSQGSQSGNSTNFGSPVSAGSVEYDLSPLMDRIRDGDSTLWPAKVLNLPGQPEINQMYSPCVLGLPLGSRPQTARDLTHLGIGDRPYPHKGCDIGALSNTKLFACFPGVISYNETGKESAGIPTTIPTEIAPSGKGWIPKTQNYASLSIVSNLQFASGEVATIKVTYGHVRKFVKLSGNGNHAIISGTPDKPVLVGYSGGASNDPGKGPSTGAHLHWELYDFSHEPRAPVYKNSKVQGSHFLYRGALKDPVTLQYGGVAYETPLSEIYKKVDEQFPVSASAPVAKTVPAYASYLYNPDLTRYGASGSLLQTATEEVDYTAMVLEHVVEPQTDVRDFYQESDLLPQFSGVPSDPNADNPFNIGVHDSTTELATDENIIDIENCGEKNIEFYLEMKKRNKNVKLDCSSG